MLKARRDAGEQLQENQLKKIATEDEILRDIKALKLWWTFF